jgi:hypothetical protein
VALGYIFQPILRFSSATTIPPKLHNHINLHVSVTKRTNKRGLVTFPTTSFRMLKSAGEKRKNKCLCHRHILWLGVFLYLRFLSVRVVCVCACVCGRAPFQLWNKLTDFHETCCENCTNCDRPNAADLAFKFLGIRTRRTSELVAVGPHYGIWLYSVHTRYKVVELVTARHIS